MQQSVNTYRKGYELGLYLRMVTLKQQSASLCPVTKLTLVTRNSVQ